MLETRLTAPQIFEAADRAALIDQSLAHTPDCLIRDWELRGRSEPDHLSALRDLLPDLKIIVTSAHANAFICKTDPPAEILNAIRRLNGKDSPCVNHNRA